MNKKKSSSILILLAIFLLLAFFTDTFSSFNLSGDDVSSGSIDISISTNTVTSTTTTTYTAPGGTAPTSITISITPNPVNMGSNVLGTAISNGQNFPLRIDYAHIGASDGGSIDGLFGVDGQFNTIQTMNIPGGWWFQVVSGAIESNIVNLVVQGLLVNVPASGCSKLLMSCDDVEIQIYSHRYGDSVLVIANNPSLGISFAFHSATVNAGGYVKTTIDMSSLANGNWEIDLVSDDSGDQASSWGATDWITIGR